jgi:predicted Zn finger-like uncharacterized protein
MRLVCPNCDAEYEVDDAAIPRSGRDVQCSNCGHAWFQAHPEVLADEAEALTELEQQDSVAEDLAAEDLAGSEGLAMVPPEADAAENPPALPVSGGDTAAAQIVAPDAALPAVEAVAVTRNIDESVLAVLREEAAREVAARKAEIPAPALETQTEMPLAQASAAVANRVVARLKGEPEPKTEPQPARPRRELLPAIEEINSTLRASSGRAGEEDASLVAAEAAQAARGRFGNGFLMLVVLAAIGLALYIFAPLIASRVPALAGAATAYVAGVDTVRIWLDAEIRSLIGMLRGLEGGSQG